MTDRYNYLTVALERDIREDDAQSLISAIKMLRGVLTVEPHITEPADWLATERARQDMREKLMNVIFPKSP